MSISLRPLLLLFVLACPLAGTAQPASGARGSGAPATEHQQGDDRFVAGGSVRVVQPVPGDLIAVGGSVDVDTTVGGDAVVAGGDLRLGGATGQGLYVAGGRITLDGTVGRNARIGGGHVEMGPKAVVNGNVSIGAGDLRMEGEVKGYLQAAGGSVFLNGKVGGDVVATSGSVELGPNARIGGKLRYASRAELKRDPAAQVAGGVEQRTMPGRLHRPAHPPVAPAGGWLWTVGLLVVGIALVAGLPGFTGRAATTLRTRLGTSLLIGFITLVCVPVAAVLLLVTVVGIPLGLLALLLYPALLLVGYVMTGVGLGDWALGRYRGADASRAGWRIGATVLALLVIALLARVPWLGAIVSFLVLIAGLGALVMQARRAPAAPA